MFKVFNNCIFIQLLFQDKINNEDDEVFMTELDTLYSKSVSDLAEIASAMQLAPAESVKDMSKDELLSLITGQPAPAAEKPKKRGRPKKAETPKEEKKVESAEVPAEPAPEAASQETEKKAEKPKKKTSSRSRKAKEEKKEEPAPEQIAIDFEGDKAAPEEAPAEKAAPEKEAEEKKPARKNSKSRKRRVSFGPDKEVEEVEIPAEEQKAEEAATEADAEPQVPEIVYREVEGILSIGNGDKGDFSGFIHCNNYLPGEEDAYVPGQLIRRMGLRRGDKVKGLATPPRGKDRYAPLKKVLEVNGIDVSEAEDYDVLRKRPRFESLTAIYPNERLTLETNQEDLSTRIIDLFSPIGKGQRGMIVSPPKAGKTILLQKVANSITANNPSCKLIVLLIDERPEEVTDMQRSIKGEVVYSTFDKRPENHVRVTELVLERAMRLVELGEDVVILLDSMTRLARAYNLTITPTGRTLSGGLDPGSLYGPKRFFGAARNIEHGGSLTIISTALIETGSRMDEVIFEEFKGTGNMEVTLDRKLADRRVFPAIAVDKSGTRREDLLLSQEELEAVWLTRKAIADSDTVAATNAVLDFMKKTVSNASFILSVKKSFDP